MSAPTRGSAEDEVGSPANISRWVELFYDLAFVAGTLLLSSGAAHAERRSEAWAIVLVFAALWWVWFTTTLLANRFHMVDTLHRMILLAQMFLVVLVAMEARASVSQETVALLLVGAGLLVTVGLIAFRGRERGGPDARCATWLAIGSGVAALMLCVAALLPEPWRGLVAGAGLVVAVVPSALWLHLIREFTPTDERHMVDRVGAFTLIVLGEAFIEVAVAVSGSTLRAIDIESLSFEFILVLALFTSYFEDIPPAGLHRGRLGRWAGLHLVAVTCIAATAVAAAELVNVKTAADLPESEVFRLTVPLTVLYVALAGIGACTRRRPILPLACARFGSAAVVGVVGLIAWQVTPVRLQIALPVITLVAVLDAVAVVRLLGRTEVVSRVPGTG